MMSAPEQLRIVAMGLVTPLGYGYLPSTAALRAGISAFSELSYVDDTGGALIGAYLPEVTEERCYARRLLASLVSAIKDCLSAQGEIRLEDLPFLVALPEDKRPGIPNGLSSQIFDALERALDISIRRELSYVYPFGHVAVFRALADARALLDRSDVPACLVCGADSFIRARTLLWLADTQRLKVEVESIGIFPGEAAGAALVTGARSDASGSGPNILGIGFGVESVTPFSEEPLRADGLSAALTAALREAGVEMHDVDFRISDIAGEPYAFTEQALSLARVMRQVREEMPLWHCAEFIGETGAAVGLCELGWASGAFNKGYAPGPIAACYAGSINGDRGVAIVARSA